MEWQLDGRILNTIVTLQPHDVQIVSQLLYSIEEQARACTKKLPSDVIAHESVHWKHLREPPPIVVRRLKGKFLSRGFRLELDPAEKKELGLIVMVGCISMSSEGVNRGTDERNLETRIVVILYHQKIRLAPLV